MNKIESCSPSTRKPTRQRTYLVPSTTALSSDPIEVVVAALGKEGYRLVERSVNEAILTVTASYLHCQDASLRTVRMRDTRHQMRETDQYLIAKQRGE
jgi:hypothetical protein